MYYRIFIVLSILAIIILSTTKAFPQDPPNVGAWHPLPNRTVIVRVITDPPQERRVYTVIRICPCKLMDKERGWVLKTEDKNNPYCYSLGEQIAVMKDGIFHSITEKTYKEK